MDTRLASASSMEAVLECAVCLEIFTNPRVLPCQHTLCCHCLQDVIHAARPARKFECPTCRAQYGIPARGAESFPKNLLASSLIDTIQSAPVSNTSGAGNNSSSSSSASKRHCSQHPRQELNYYCHSCELVVCSECCIEGQGHRGHRYDKIDHASPAISAKFSSNIRKTGKYMDQLRHAKKELVDRKSQIQQDVQSARKEIHLLSETICRNIREQEREMLEKISNLEMHALNRVTLAVKEFDQKLVAAQILCSKMKEVQSREDAAEIGLETRRMQSQLEDMKKLPLESVTWESRIAKKEGVLPMGHFLGKVNIRDGGLKRLSSISSSPENNQTLGPPLQQIALNCRNDVTGLAVVHGCLYVTHFRDPHIWVYDTEGKLLVKLGIPRLFGPCGLAVFDEAEGEIAITDTATVKLIPKPPCKLHLLKLTEDHIIEDHKTRRLDYVPGQVTIDKAKHMLIAVLGEKRFMIHHRHEDTSESVQLPATLSSPSQILRSASIGFIIVEHFKVIWLDNKVKVVKFYEGRSQTDLMGSAVQVLQDAQNRLVIVDRNKHQLHLLDSDGHFEQYLLPDSQTIKKPSRVFLDEGGYLYVAHGEGNKMVNVYSYRGDPKSEDLVMTSTHFNLRLMLNDTKQ